MSYSDFCLAGLISLYDSQGVIRNATTVLVTTLTGTLNAMGAIYGPIIPVM